MKKGIYSVPPFSVAVYCIHSKQLLFQELFLFIKKTHCHREELIFFPAYYICKRRKPHQNRIERDRISLSTAFKRSGFVLCYPTVAALKQLGFFRPARYATGISNIPGQPKTGQQYMLRKPYVSTSCRKK